MVTRHFTAGVLVGAAVAVIALTPFIVPPYFIAGGSVALDGPPRFCSATGVPSVSVLMIDIAGPVNDDQELRIRQLAGRQIRLLEAGERMDIYAVGDTPPRAGLPRISLCRPSTEGAWWQWLARWGVRYDSDLAAVVDAILVDLVRAPLQPTSRIIETLRTVCMRSFGDLAAPARATLVLISDLVQRSPAIDHTRTYDFTAFAKGEDRSVTFANCQHARTTVLYVQRREFGAIQGRPHLDFWVSLFRQDNADLIEVETL